MAQLACPVLYIIYIYIICIRDIIYIKNNIEIIYIIDIIDTIYISYLTHIYMYIYIYHIQHNIMYTKDIMDTINII